MLSQQEIELLMLYRENAELRRTLTLIAKWDLPNVLNSRGVLVAYELAQGSNGARDYVRRIAQESLDKVTSA